MKDTEQHSKENKSLSIADNLAQQPKSTQAVGLSAPAYQLPSPIVQMKSKDSTQEKESGGIENIPNYQYANPLPIQRRVDRSAQELARNQHDARGVDTPSEEVVEAHPQWNDTDMDPPDIQHDHGFLDDGDGNIDDSLREEATWGDHLERLKWIAKLEGAELLRPDLIDGTRAYRHFLFGDGADYTFSYERFVNNDSSGETVLQSAIDDVTEHALTRHDQIVGQNVDAVPTHSSFSFRSDVITVGGDARYPYPATENWQKAIGGHPIWIEAQIEVEVDHDTNQRTFTIEMTIHMEDMYNFNPGQADIVSGSPDAANGRFEVTGLGHEFLQTSSLSRTINRTYPMACMVNPENGSGGVSGNPRTPARSRRAVEGGTRRN